MMTKLGLGIHLTRIRRKSFRTLSMKKPSLSSLMTLQWLKPRSSSRRMLLKETKMRSVKTWQRSRQKKRKSLRSSRM